jgi:hypothetical protein
MMLVWRPDMSEGTLAVKFRLSRTVVTFIVLNELRGLAMIAPALIATLKLHHWL